MIDLNNIYWLAKYMYYLQASQCVMIYSSNEI